MRKQDFFNHCNKSLRTDLKVVVESARREIYPQVSLHGAWGKSMDCVYYSSITLFTPQHRKLDFRKWHDVCSERAIKFERWLKEWKELNGHC